MSSILKCDLHIHSQFSDGKLSIKEIVDLYGKRGFGAIAITDHVCETSGVIGQVSHRLSYSLSQEVFPVYIKTIRDEAVRAWKTYGMLLIPGFEITKNSFVNQRSAHILILGVEEFISPDLPVEEILSEAKRKNGFTIAAHPFHTGDFEFQTFYLWSNREKLSVLIDAWEVNYRKNISPAVMESGLPLIANSDFHHRGHFSSWKTKVESDLTQAGLFASIKKQKVDFFLDQI